MNTARNFLLLILPLVASCISVDPKERFPDVSKEIEQRLGQRVHWSLGGPEDEEIDRFVADLLSRPLSPDTAVQVALLRSKDLQAAYEDLGVAQADLVQAGFPTNPDIAGFFRIPDSGPKGTNWNVGLDFFLDFFLVPLRKRIAGAELEAAILRVSEAVLEKAVQVRQAYFDYHTELQIFEAQKELAEFTEVAAQLSERQREAGHVPDLDVEKEKIGLEEARLALDQAEAATHIRREQLRRLLDLTDSDLDWKVEPLADAIPKENSDSESLLCLALNRRIDLALAAREIENQRLGLELDKKWFLSKGALGIETERSSDGVQGTGAHFSVELPIFHQHQAIYARREALLRQAERRLEAQRGAARAEVRIASEKMALARRVVERYRDSLLPARGRIVSLTQSEYNAMLIGVFDLLKAKEEETRTSIEYARALRDYWTGRAEMERALGLRLPELSEPREKLPQERPQERPPEKPEESKPKKPHEGYGVR